MKINEALSGMFRSTGHTLDCSHEGVLVKKGMSEYHQPLS